MPVINITADAEISSPIMLQSRDILRGNGYRLKPVNGYEGAAVEIQNANYASVQDCHFQGFRRAISVSGKSNFTHVENTFIVDCITGITSHEAWDSHYQNVQILRAEVGIIITGTKERPSNPHTFYNLQVESFKNSAVVVSQAHNLVFLGGKFHGNIENPPLNYTVNCLTKNWPVITFHGAKFFFNPSGHFDSRQKPKVKLICPLIDNAKQMANVYMFEPVTNERK